MTKYPQQTRTVADYLLNGGVKDRSFVRGQRGFVRDIPANEVYRIVEIISWQSSACDGPKSVARIAFEDDDDDKGDQKGKRPNNWTELSGLIELAPLLDDHEDLPVKSKRTASTQRYLGRK